MYESESPRARGTIGKYFEISGAFPQTDDLVLVALARNERNLIEAFLRHYRALGVTRFVIWDDQSTDGTREFLLGQADCTVLASHMRYGDTVVIDTPRGETSGRAGVLFKSAIPSLLGLGNWILLVDIDEYLFLPEALGTLKDLCRRLDEKAIDYLRTALVEFYPPTLWAPTDSGTIDDPAEMLRRFGSFDANPVVFVEGRTVHHLADTASMRLFRQMGIAQGWRGAWPPRRLLSWITREPVRTPVMKTPLVKWSGSMFLDGNHPAAGATDPVALLGMAHFKFTPDLDRRTALAIETQAYAGKSTTYDSYAHLLRRMRSTGRLSFSGPRTRRFSTIEDFYTAVLPAPAREALQRLLKAEDASVP